MAKSLRQTTMKVKIDVDGKGLEVADKKIKDTATEAEKLENASKKTGKAVEGTGKSLKEAAKSAEESSKSLKKQADNTNEAAKNADKLTDSSKALKDVLSTIGAAAVAKQMYELGKAAIQVGMDFDSGMSQVKAVSGASAKDFEAMRNQAIQLGADTTKSAKEVSEGQLELAKSGMSAKQAMQAIPGAISASQASGEDMAVAVSVMTSALNGFQLKASESAHVADVLAMAANKSKADINDMGYAFKYAATPAKALGVSLEETSSAVMIMTNAGLAGEQAGTSLRSALISLSKPSEDASKQMDKLGVKITDAKGNMRPFADITDDLRKKTEGMGNAQKMNALSTIFGTEAASGMLAIIDSAPGTMQKFTKSLKESDGASKKASDTMTNNLAGSVENLKGTIESIAINVSDVLTPTIRKGVDTLADLGDGFNNLTPSAKSMVVWGSVIVGGVIPASIALYKVHKAVKSVREVMGGAKTFFNSYRREMQLTGAQASTTAKQIQTMNTAMNGGSTGKGSSKRTGGGTFIAPSIGKNGLGKVGKGGLLKTGGTTLKSVGKRIPVAGTLLGVGLLAAGGKENLGSNAGSLGGGAAGAVAGAAIGSVIPGVGTAIGGTIGGIAGSIFGEKFGASAQKSLEKNTPKVQKSLRDGLDFGKNVSKGTSSAVKEYEKLNTKATEQLDLLYYRGEKISSKTSKSLKYTYGKMASSIEKSMKSKFGKSTKTISSFLKDSGFSEKEQKSILGKMNKSHKQQEKAVEKSQQRINSILKKATKEKRQLTAHEREIINKEQEKMRTRSVKTLSKSAKEQRTIMTALKNDSSRLSAKQAADVVKQSKKAKDGAVKEANKKYKSVVAAADAEYYDNHSISKKQHDDIIKKAKDTRDKSVNHAEKMHEGVVKQAKQQATAHIKEVDWETGQVLTKWQTFKTKLASVVNGISTGINQLLDAFGISAKIPMWSPAGYGNTNSNSTSHPQAIKGAYATGTNHHPGGAAVVGEEGPELAYTPYGDARLVGQNGAEIVNLPKGAKVLTASQTRQMMSGGLSGTMPGYAKGIGNKISDFTSDMFDFISNPSAVIKKLIAKHSIGKDMMGLGAAALEKIKDSAVNFMKDKMGDIASIGAVGGAGSAQARKWIMAAMAITHTPMSYLNGLMTIAKRESGFNPKAINLWDSNAKAGHPSQGLFQTIPSTFAAHRNKSLPNDITNPIANAVSAINYMNSRYGGIGNVPGLRNLASGKGYVGYKKGGFKNNHDSRVLVGEEGPELVDLPFGSQVHNNRKTNDLLDKKDQVVINFNPVINVKVEGKTETTESAIERAVNKALEAAFKDLRGIFDSGVSY